MVGLLHQGPRPPRWAIAVHTLLAVALASLWTRAGTTAAATGTVLFFDKSVAQAWDARLQLEVQRPVAGPLAIAPTEPWESWAVFGYNHVMLSPNATLARALLYYDCIEASAEGKIGPRRICVAFSDDGVRWTKPSLDVYAYPNRTGTNILLDGSGVSVFVDTRPGVPAQERFKMTASNAMYASGDGLRFTAMYNHTSIHHADDTKDTAVYEAALDRYIVYVRRDIQLPNRSAGVVRRIGRCVTDDLSNWEKETPSGCPSVFGPDAVDPDEVDVYTNSLTLYEGNHLFFPSFYHHFGPSNPYHFGNDGILDIRFVYARNATASRLLYPDAVNARQPFVRLGLNLCGPSRSQPSTPGGWCSPSDGSLARTSVDTSATYMASGLVPSVDGSQLFLYSSAQPMTHGGDAASKTWGSNTGIRVQALRKDGFVGVRAPYLFNVPATSLPALTLLPLGVPDDCPGKDPVLILNIQTSVVGMVLVAIEGDPSRTLAAANPVRGNSLDAVPSWGPTAQASLATYAGRAINVTIAMTDATLFAVRAGCNATASPS